MPRAFSEGERAAIRARLLEHGRACLAAYGVRKTSVADLASAAGISKGAFYLFFSSKEELFLSLLEEFEATYRAELLTLGAGADQTPRARVRAVLERTLALFRASPFFPHIGRDDYNALLRGLPAERLQAHLRADEDFVERLLAGWEAAGLVLPWTASELTGLLRALIILSLHADDSGTGVTPRTVDLLIELIADRAGPARSAAGDDRD